MKAKGNILVVDDEPCVRDIYLQFLRLSGYEVDASGSGEEALEAVAQQPYDLLILDLCLTGMDGLRDLFACKDDRAGHQGSRGFRFAGQV